jgi:hypothetical protein
MLNPDSSSNAASYCEIRVKDSRRFFVEREVHDLDFGQMHAGMTKNRKDVSRFHVG